MAEVMFYHDNHSQLFPSMFLDLFVTSNQVDSYDTRTHCHTNHKQFTILYQGSKIWNSFPVSVTDSRSFPSSHKKMYGLLKK